MRFLPFVVLCIFKRIRRPTRHCEEERSDDAAIQRARKRAKQKRCLRREHRIAFCSTPAGVQLDFHGASRLAMTGGVAASFFSLPPAAADVVD
jgi:hypothetical protein